LQVEITVDDLSEADFSRSVDVDPVCVVREVILLNGFISDRKFGSHCGALSSLLFSIEAPQGYLKLYYYCCLQLQVAAIQAEREANRLWSIARRYQPRVSFFNAFV
jgi:hypothetical protein